MLKRRTHFSPSPMQLVPRPPAHRLLLLVASLCSQLSCKKVQLKELLQKADKAKRDAARGKSLKVADAADAAALPEITDLNLPVALAERELCKSLADQARNTESFTRESTSVAVEGAALRVSPLQGLSLSEYMLAAKHLQKEFQFDASYLIKACAALDKEGGQMPLSQLWKVAGGPPGTASASKKVDLLMRAPLVAVRVGAGEAFDSSWFIMAKEPNTNYTQLASVMARIERRDCAQKSISKARLRALTRLASTEADRKLIELGALDQASASKARALSGRCHESAAAVLERERAMQAAVETLAAYDDLAKLDTLAEISALMGETITDAGLQAEIDRLTQREEALQSAEEDGMVFEAWLPHGARYDMEDPDQELELESDFHDVLESCDAEEADELAARIKAAAAEAGCSIELDSVSLKDEAKQEQLSQLFGKGWDEALASCLAEPLVPGRDDDSTPDSDAGEGDVRDHADEMLLEVRREMGLEGAEAEGEDEGEGEGAAEAMILAQFTPAQLVTKLLARHRLRRQKQAKASEELAAAQRSLAGERGRSAHLDTVLSNWPDIGDKIEAICKDLYIGADAHRKDGALTISRAAKCVKGGVGFKQILVELEQRHDIKISYRALHDLRTIQDRRKRSAARQKGVVDLKLRRSVKRIGQDNLDDHAQNAMYRLVHYLRDRTSFEDTLWIQRDDHSKVRGGSSESTRGATVTATGEGASAQQHDYMNPDLFSTMYATSMLVSGCADGGAERCLAVVKADKLSPSTPTQHYADFYMLQDKARTDPELLHSRRQGEAKGAV